MDGGTITRYDLKIGRYCLHAWQMYGPDHPWNWSLQDQSMSTSETKLISTYIGEDTAIIAKNRLMKAFIWYFVMRLARNTDEPDMVLKGFK